MRPSPALVVAVIALFVALGGTSYAVTQLPRNSVGTSQLRDGAVTKQKIARATRQALRGAQGSAGERGPQGATGPQGPAGTQGPQGADGADGAPGTTFAARVGLSGGPVTIQPGEQLVLATTGGWTQAAGEVDLLITSMDFSVRPTTCSGPDGSRGIELVLTSADWDLGFARASSLADDPDNASARDNAMKHLPAPDTATSRPVTATLRSNCAGLGEMATLSDLSLDVIAFR